MAKSSRPGDRAGLRAARRVQVANDLRAVFQASDSAEAKERRSRTCFTSSSHTLLEGAAG